MGTQGIPRILSDKEIDVIKDCLEYNSKTGKIFWKKKRKQMNIGSEAGHLTKRGYIDINILSRPVRAHRIAWILYYGVQANSMIDHINGIKNDNRISNLRIADRSLNSQNMKVHRSGQHVGISFKRDCKKWQVRIPKKYGSYSANKRKFIGYFKTFDEAKQEFDSFIERNS